MRKTFITVILAGMITVPLFASAATIDDLKAQIQSLLGQISELQKQITARTGTVATSTATGTGISGGGSWCYDFNRSLKRGARGADVEALHTALEHEGLTISEREKQQNVFGTSTAAAVARYQQNNKDSITGYEDPAARGLVGPQTRAVLGREYGCGQRVGGNPPIIEASTTPRFACPMYIVRAQCKAGEEAVLETDQFGCRNREVCISVAPMTTAPVTPTATSTLTPFPTPSPVATSSPGYGTTTAAGTAATTTGGMPWNPLTGISQTTILVP